MRTPGWPKLVGCCLAASRLSVLACLPACLPDVQSDIDMPRMVQSGVRQLPTLARQLALGWSDKVLAS